MDVERERVIRVQLRLHEPDGVVRYDIAEVAVRRVQITILEHRRVEVVS